MARSWYTYGGGDYDQPSSYLYATTKPACRTGYNLCSIYAAYGGVFPAVISDNLLTYISNGLANGVPEPQIPAGAKKYIYMKTIA
ncbi:hypothetical protein [Mucilaginibacter sp. UR6-11]|uniref:hypothetical protein n=1 Tax=Mucilaginibacter sp. UR6-11 TaxID=1435644 RepID=UPI001E425F2C|nr:hypothetical protein [Mucilaginibacter sp. UR6-11]MCC8423674.1 hypothetical protein [Mucilaginibacter sp. UR6-11]